VSFLTTLAGYVHWQLTGQKVLGFGDASGMFPVDPDTLDYDAARLSTFDDHLGEALPDGGLRSLLPQVIAAGRPAGELTERGAGHRQRQRLHLDLRAGRPRLSAG